MVVTAIWQVKISRDSALQSSKLSLCRVDSWRRVKSACSDPGPHLPSFVPLRNGHRLRVHPFAAAPPVCASLLVVAHQAHARPLSPASKLRAQPHLQLSWRFVPVRCLTIRAGLQRLGCCGSGFSQPCKQARRWRFPWPFAPTPPPPSSTRVNTCAFDLYYLALFRRHLIVHALHCLLSSTRHCLALLLSFAFSSIRHGSLLTSRTSY